jgi:hypothetical protein
LANWSGHGIADNHVMGIFPFDELDAGYPVKELLLNENCSRVVKYIFSNTDSSEKIYSALTKIRGKMTNVNNFHDWAYFITPMSYTYPKEQSFSVNMKIVDVYRGTREEGKNLHISLLPFESKQPVRALGMRGGDFI